MRVAEPAAATAVATACVLTVASEKAHQGLGNMLRTFGFDVAYLRGPDDVAAALANRPALVVLDLATMPADGVRLLNRFSQVRPSPQAVLMGTATDQSGVGIVEFHHTVAMDLLARAWHVEDLGELEHQLRRKAAPADVLRRSLPAAFENHEFVLHYQPIFDVRKGEPERVALEAFVRWNHPELGLLGPGDFLATAREAGMMSRLTDITLQLAAEQLTAWKKHGRRLPVSVNVGAELLTDEQFPARLLRALGELAIGPEDLILEVAEHGVMSERPEPVAVVADLIERGFRLVIDDFGRGSISLIQVMTLRFEALKIDGSLIRQVSRNDRAKQLVRGIVRLAHDLGMRTCAESVESAETLFLLKGLGCDEAQGWHLGRPLPASALPPS